MTVAGGADPAVSSVSVSGTTVTLTLAAAVTAGPALTVTYTPGSNPVQDGSGLDALPLTGQEVGIEDTTPPIPASAEVPASGDTLNLTFNEDLDIGPGKLPPADAFTVKADGVEVTVQSVAEGSGSDNFILNLLSSTIKQGQTVTVDYAMPATNPIQDTAGNDALAFTDSAGRQQLHRGGNPAGARRAPRCRHRATDSPSPSTTTSTSRWTNSPRRAPSP